MYITRQGECWDEAAKSIYGSEKYVGFLMQSNMKLLDIVIFPDGMLLNTPVIPAEETNLPSWRKRK